MFFEIFPLSVPQIKIILRSNTFQNAGLKLKQVMFYKKLFQRPSFFHSTNNLLHAYHIPGTDLSLGVTTVNKINKIPALVEHSF